MRTNMPTRWGMVVWVGFGKNLSPNFCSDGGDEAGGGIGRQTSCVIACRIKEWDTPLPSKGRGVWRAYRHTPLSCKDHAACMTRTMARLSPYARQMILGYDERRIGDFGARNVRANARCQIAPLAARWPAIIALHIPLRWDGLG